MRVVILAGGEGTRLKPLSDAVPKPLIPIKGEPIISRLIDFFLRYDARGEFGVIVSRRHEEQFKKWKNAFERTHIPRIRCSLFVEDKPMGTFGYLRRLEGWIGGESFFLVNGDNLLDFDLNELVAFHDREAYAATIGLMRVENAGEYGSVVLEGSKVRGFEEKSANLRNGLVSIGVYLLEPSMFRYADPSRDFLMIEKDIFPPMACDGALGGFEIPDGKFLDCGTFDRLARAEREW